MNTDSASQLMSFYQAMLARFGRQNWWPGETPFEIMVGAVLTQNTSWTNVEKAIANLKAAELLTPEKIYSISQQDLSAFIRPAGYMNVKAKRLKNLVKWFCEEHAGEFESLEAYSVDQLRETLILINGIGRETADAIILYALKRPTFVVDTYTYRLLVRHQCVSAEADYEEMKEFFERNLPEEVELYNEFHALIVQVGKNHCKPVARCEGCPLEQFEHCLEG
jgi:endonuclease-3 related protein